MDFDSTSQKISSILRLKLQFKNQGKHITLYKVSYLVFIVIKGNEIADKVLKKVISMPDCLIYTNPYSSIKRPKNLNRSGSWKQVIASYITPKYLVIQCCNIIINPSLPTTMKTRLS